MTTAGARSATIPMRFDLGMYSAGDKSTAPDGTVSVLRNYVFRPNRLEARPAFRYDSLMSVMGLCRWEDLANQRTSTMAFDATKIYKKPSSGSGWDAGTSATFGTRLTDYANIYGKLYAMFDDGSGNPSAALVYDGASVSATPFNSSLFSRTITPHIERLFFAYPRVTFTNLNVSVGDAYDWTNARYTKTNVNANLITQATGAIVCRLSPQSTAASACSVLGVGAIAGFGKIGVTAAATVKKYVWLFQARAVHPTFDVPITLEWILMQSVQVATAYAAGDLVSDPTTSTRQRCITAGTTAGVAPAYSATSGNTTADGTVTWLCEGTNILSASETFVINATSSPEFVSYYVECSVPPRTNDVNISPRLKFYNSTVTSLSTLAPIDISFKDGITDGDLRKANKGQQWTAGDFYYPFFNQESSATATVNLDCVVWSEVGQPSRIIAKNTFPLVEVPGLATAAAVVSGRYIVFKRRGMWVFKSTTNKNEPILPERPANVEIGCIGPRALDVFDDELFWIGEQGVYRMRMDGQPTEFAGPGMREEIMSKGDNWVESQSTYRMPFLVVNKSVREVWVYTQKSKIYVFNLDNNAWSYIDVSGSPEIRSMIFDTIAQRMLVSFGGFGVAWSGVSDPAFVFKDTIDNTATNLTITSDIVFKPFELFAPRYEASLQEIGLFHLATFTQTGMTVTPSYSYDRGSTYTTPSGYPVTASLSSPRVRMPLVATGPSVTVKVSRAGSGGPGSWALSKADATLRVHRGELPYVNPS